MSNQANSVSVRLVFPLIPTVGLGYFKILLKSAIHLFAFFDLIEVKTPQQVKEKKLGIGLRFEGQPILAPARVGRIHCSRRDGRLSSMAYSTVTAYTEFDSFG